MKWRETLLKFAVFWLLVTSTTMLPWTGTKLSQSKAEKVLLILSHHPFFPYFSSPQPPSSFLSSSSTLDSAAPLQSLWKRKKCGEGRKAGTGGITKGMLTPSFTTSSTSTLLQGCGAASCLSNEGKHLGQGCCPNIIIKNIIKR